MKGHFPAEFISFPNVCVYMCVKLNSHLKHVFSSQKSTFKYTYTLFIYGLIFLQLIQGGEVNFPPFDLLPGATFLLFLCPQHIISPPALVCLVLISPPSPPFLSSFSPPFWILFLLSCEFPLLYLPEQILNGFLDSFFLMHLVCLSSVRI